MCLQHLFQACLGQFGFAPLRNAAISLPFADHFFCCASSTALSAAFAALSTLNYAQNAYTSIMFLWDFAAARKETA
jgi:hypothetical protein